MATGQQRHEDELGRSDIEALGATRAELGRDYEDALLDSFADRVERAIDARVAGELARRHDPRRHASGLPAHAQPQSTPGSGAQLSLAIVSTVALVPISIPLGLTGNWFALLMVLATILGVNVAHALHYRRRDPHGR